MGWSDDLICENCGKVVAELHKTEDAVFLCKPCYDECCKEWDELSDEDKKDFA
jgi:hypothetical protein